jgi:Leucine-rich repeat (LRR) protein
MTKTSKAPSLDTLRASLPPLLEQLRALVPVYPELALGDSALDTQLTSLEQLAAEICQKAPERKVREEARRATAARNKGPRSVSLVQLRKGLSAKDWETVHQAVELGLSLGDDSVTEVLLSGLYLEKDGSLVITPDSEVHKRTRADFRERAAWRLMSLAGRLKGQRALVCGLELSAEELPLYLDAPALERLSLRSSSAKDLSFVSQYPALRELKLRYHAGSVEGLERRPELEVVEVEAHVGNTTPPGVPLPNLRSWWFPWTEQTSIEWLGKCKKLERLAFQWKGDLDALSPLTQLKDVNLLWSSATSLAPLARNTGMETLSCSAMKQLKDVSAIAGFKGLRRLNFYSCESLRELSSVKDLRELEFLGVQKCKVTTPKFPTATQETSSKAAIRAYQKAWAARAAKEK